MHEKWYIRSGIYSIGNSSINHFATIKSEGNGNERRHRKPWLLRGRVKKEEPRRIFCHRIDEGAFFNESKVAFLVHDVIG